MKIEEIANESNPLAQPQQRQEVQRLAQSIAAERFASTQAVQNATAVSPADRQDDIAALSSEAVKEVTEKGGRSGFNRVDGLIGALKESMENIAQDPTRRDKASKGKGGGGKQDKKTEVKVTEEWIPSVQEGDIREGRAVIGQIKRTREVKEVPGDGGGRGGDAQAGGGRGGDAGRGPAPSQGSGNSSAGAIKGPANGSGNTGSITTQPFGAAAKTEGRPAGEAAGGSKNQRAGEREQESASAAENLKDQGLRVSGPGKGQQNGNEGGGTEVLDVRTRATGLNQRLTVRPAGTLRESVQKNGNGQGGGGGGGAPLGTFRTLDDKPILRHATLHSRNTEDAEREIKKKAAVEGEPPEKVREMLQLLRDKTRPDG